MKREGGREGRGKVKESLKRSLTLDFWSADSPLLLLLLQNVFKHSSTIVSGWVASWPVQVSWVAHECPV